MDKYISVEKAFTHAGNFHADDVFSGAFLQLLNPDIRIERGFNPPKDYEGIVFDIGGGAFDHHSIHREVRENGVMFASFGKLWREFSDLIVSSDVSKAIDEELICPIDNNDNTGERELLSGIIYNMNSYWNEDSSKEESDRRYLQAVSFAKGVLIRYIEKFNSIREASDYVLDCYNKACNGVVIFEKYVPWKETLRNLNVKVVVYPSNRGGWNAERIENSGFEFPISWWGSRDKSLVDGFIFCHATGFLVNFETYETLMCAIDDIQKGRDLI